MEELPKVGRIAIAKISIDEKKTGFTAEKDNHFLPMAITDTSGKEYSTDPRFAGQLIRCVRMMPVLGAECLPHVFDMDKNYSWINELRKMYNGICVCGKPAEKVCGRCKERRYCSRECQVSDWDVHKTDCIAYRDDLRYGSLPSSNPISCAFCNTSFDDAPLVQTAKKTLVCIDCVNMIGAHQY